MKILLLIIITLYQCNNILTQHQDNGIDKKLLTIPNINENQQQLRYDAPDDCHYNIIDINEVTLLCNLRTINSEYDTTNFSVIPSENTISLHIICNDDIMLKSHLEIKSFIHLIKLKELKIFYCKIDELNEYIFDGLINLKNLTIRTHNIYWPSLNLNLNTNTFNLIKNIERLDLSQNNIWSLPNEIFCGLNDIKYLNLSENRIQDINELGFRDNNNNNNDDIINKTILERTSCYLDLEILDISYNHLVLLPNNGFSTLKRLKQLIINNNEISMIADKALNGLKNLQIIDISSNKIVALPSDLFKDQLLTIQEIYLQNNTISVLSPKLFTNLEQLQALDLSNNQLTSIWINHNTFIGLIRLVLLNLSYNKITKLDSEIFADLYTLQILNLRYNLIDNIISNTFTPMNNLHTLLLSHNKLKYLDNLSLNGLYVLSLLSLDNNELIGIHPDAFRNCSSLQDLNLNGNQLKSIPIALRNMRMLRTIDLGENLIQLIDENSFRGLNNLYGLRLIGNYLKNITKLTFKDLPNLQILNLARNQIDYIENNSFDMITNIQAIRLDGNYLTNINYLFNNIKTLVWLNISDNKLNYFDFNQIPNDLQWLDLHKNNIKNINNIIDNNNIRLQTLDLSFNYLTYITSNIIPNSIELLFLNDNLINLIDSHTFLNKLNLTRVDLYANQLKTLDIKSIRLTSINNKKLLPEFYIGGNPFICDCNIDWLQKINNLKTRQYPKIMDLDTIYCKLLNNRERNYIQLIDAETKHFLCTYKTHCFALCHCCEFDACDCEMTCPTNCTCFHDQSWSTNIVECTNNNYNIMPINIPMDTTELYIDGNNLNKLSGHSFIGRKNLIILYGNNSNIEYIYNTTFIGLNKLLILHLEYNLIKYLTGQEFNTLENLRELYLNNNQIDFILNTTFINLRKLEVLRLDNNKLINYDVWLLLLNPYLVQITLSNNLWSCDCHYLNNLRNYLKSNIEKISDHQYIKCIYNNITKIILNNNNNDTKCILNDNIPKLIHKNDIENLLPLLLIVTCCFVGLFSLIFGLIYYRNELKLWYKNNNILNICFNKNDNIYIKNNDNNKLYDAYITYSLKDEHFINNILIENLENNFGYRLCLHYRDFNINTYINDIILEAIENSKQIIIILSKNFLYNEWTRYEYKNLINDLIKRKYKLIFILYGDIPKKDIDNEMKLYLRTNTCIEWDDKKFWYKLRLILPTIRKTNLINKNKHTNTINIYATPHNYTINDNDNINDINNKHYDCNNYATINDYHHNYNTDYDNITCKYKKNKFQQLQQKNDLSIKSLDRRKQHEYAVPTNCLYGQKSNYSIDDYENNSLLDKNICDYCPRIKTDITDMTTINKGLVGGSGCTRTISTATTTIEAETSTIATATTALINDDINDFHNVCEHLKPTIKNNKYQNNSKQLTTSNNLIDYQKCCNCNQINYTDIECNHSNGSLSDVNSLDKRLSKSLWA